LLRDIVKRKQVFFFLSLVLFCGLLIPIFQILAPGLGIIGILLSIMIISGVLRRVPIRQSLPYLLSAAIIVSVIHYSVLWISCSSKPLRICEWNYGFYSFFFGGLLIMSFALDQLVIYSSKRRK
jgi:hypothetical protein